MPWWAALYIAMFAGLGVVGAFTDLRGRKRAVWHVAFDITSATALIFLMLGRWHQHLVMPLGAWAPVLFAALVVWDVYSTRLDLAELDHDPELTSRENEVTNWLGVLVGAVVIAPAYALALFSVVQTWRGAA
jgi:hypothetical protein